jgi:hypothetical protein
MVIKIHLCPPVIFYVYMYIIPFLLFYHYMAKLL